MYQIRFWLNDWKKTMTICHPVTQQQVEMKNQQQMDDFLSLQSIHENERRGVKKVLTLLKLLE